jgi:hypothetical protein
VLLQVLNSCRYVSYITYTGSEQVRAHVVAAADSGGLCEALPE